jgi:CRP-like cAMP-binding protein
MAAIRKKFKRGDIVFAEGSRGNTFYYIEKGKVEVSRSVGGKKTVLSMLSAGGTFGEYALLGGDKGVHSATVTIIEDSELVVIDKTALENTLKGVPVFVFALLKNLIQKLLNLEEASIRMQRQCQDFNLVHLLEILNEQQESLLQSFPVYLKRYTSPERRQILDYMDKMIAVGREKYKIPIEEPPQVSE